jgi:branched-chain amino acid aminotransferase
MVEKVEKIWMNGKWVGWDQAQVHIMTLTLHYGLGVFEGIRFYAQKSDGKPAVFRHREHIKRLFDSAKILGMEIPYSMDEILEAQRELVRTNKLNEGYIRPLVYMADGSMGLAAKNPIHVAIITFPWGAYLGEDGVKNGIRAKISSYSRHYVNAMMTKAKACGAYINSILAKHEALNAGYEEGILLDVDGYVSEGSGENIFMVRNQKIKTTPVGTILEGITRDTVIQILKDQGHEVIEERFTRDELWTADEVFLTGTAAEITPVREIDDRKIGPGKPGKITKQVQDIFHRLVRGEESRYAEWLDRI